ncbi:hypothetical protein SODG_002315 [Sodalis praecaptivus]|nr:hypothetical protein NVIRENTERO_03672 [Sodalis praecaptivus]
MRLLYGKRRALLTQLVLHWLGPEALAPDSNAGLHLILALTANTDDARLAEEAARQGIHVRPLSSYYLRAPRGGVCCWATPASMKTGFNQRF